MSQKSSTEEVAVMLYWAVTRIPAEFPLSGVISTLLVFVSRQLSMSYVKTLFLNVTTSGQFVLREIVSTAAALNSCAQGGPCGGLYLPTRYFSVSAQYN